MSKYVLAIDQGTTGTTLLLLDEEGRTVGQVYSEFEQHYPRPGWVEHDAVEIWNVTRRLIGAVLGDAGATAAEVAAVGITNQRETTVVWDRKTGQPIHRAIVWQDRRTAPLVERQKEDGHEAVFRKRTGLVLDAYFSGTKVQWILDHVEGARERAEAGELAFGTIDSWLVWNLTGGRVHATDYTNASRTLLFDIHARTWDTELCRLLTVPESLLPEVHPSAGPIAECDAHAAVGLTCPVAGIAGDQQAALYGQCCFEQGMVKNTYGTGCFMLLYCGHDPVESRGGLLTTLACDAFGQPAYALEGSVFIAGAAIQWLRDELRIIERADETDEIARSIESTGGVYLVPAFAGLGAPYWDMGARGALVGLTRGAGRAEIVRAALEAMAYQSRDVVSVMTADSGLAARQLRVDGGASRNDFLMQFQADLLGVPVDRPERTETTALGAAFLAGLGAGVWPDPSVVAALRKTGRVFEPCADRSPGEALYAGWKQAVGRVRSDR